jgi:hypothetical protein
MGEAAPRGFTGDFNNSCGRDVRLKLCPGVIPSEATNLFFISRIFPTLFATAA